MAEQTPKQYFQEQVKRALATLDDNVLVTAGSLLQTLLDFSEAMVTPAEEPQGDEDTFEDAGSADDSFGGEDDSFGDGEEAALEDEGFDAGVDFTDEPGEDEAEAEPELEVSERVDIDFTKKSPAFINAHLSENYGLDGKKLTAKYAKDPKVQQKKLAALAAQCDNDYYDWEATPAADMRALARKRKISVSEKNEKGKPLDDLSLRQAYAVAFVSKMLRPAALNE